MTNDLERSAHRVSHDTDADAGQEPTRPSRPLDPWTTPLGAFAALITLAAAVALAIAINEVTHGRWTRALWLAAGAVAVRVLAFALVDAVVATRARTLRHDEQTRFAQRLARSTVDELHALDTAVDHLADEPALAATTSGVVFSLLALPVLFVEAGWLPTSIVVALMALSVPAYVSSGRHSAQQMIEFHRRRGVLVTRQLDLLRSMTDLRALGAVQHGADEVAAASNAESRAVLAGVRAGIRSSLVTEFLGGVSVGLVAMVVGIRLWHHSIPLRNALIAVFIVAELFAWIRRFGAEFHRRDDAAHARRELSVSPPGVSVPASGLLLDLEAVRTEAPAGEVTVRLAARGRLRITGPSGIGKSSLIEAALGLREPTGGRVERTDVPIGLVRADSRFLRASLRENLDPAGEHPDEDLRATLVIVGLSTSRFGDLDEVLNNEDASMSSGERVQLAIARSLLATVSLLVLDDVGGLLDEPTRARLAAAIDERPEMAVLEAGHDRFLVEGTEVLELVVAP